MDTPAFPPPEAPETPSHWAKHKGKYLIGAAAVVVIGVIGAATSEDEADEAAPVEAEAPATTEAVVVETTEAPEPTAAPTTEAPTTTRAPAPPPPPPVPDESLADLVEDLWLETTYCWSDCTTAYTPQQWIDAAEWYGQIDADDFTMAYTYTDALPAREIDQVCDGFWVMADDEVADMAISNGIDPAAFVLNLYVWCDS